MAPRGMCGQTFSFCIVCYLLQIRTCLLQGPLEQLIVTLGSWGRRGAENCDFEFYCRCWILFYLACWELCLKDIVL